MSEWPSQPVTSFRGKALPEPGTPVGYAALISYYDLQLPTPPRLTAIAERHASTAEWRMLTPRHRPAASFAGLSSLR
ncbi:MAG: hypothetical protein Q8Q79_12540 [Sphingopyxis sp.]|nr:hypothetical protein [Sphingopyxis sp.]